MDSQQTRILAGRYELSHLIARGGMADVYRAHDLLLDRTVALKVLFPELSVDRSFVERFRREAQAAARLSHPNIVPVFDGSDDGSTYFIVMEFIDGRPLSSILRTAGPLHPERAAEIAADVASALAYAHRNGVVHRDVKPGNVLITDEGTVKVTDFGIARAINTEDSLTQTGAVMGTATYFSPEQAEGAGVDSRSDIYSLGVVLFEMVTGRPPFLGDSPVAVASKHVREDPPNARDINPAVPADLEAIIQRCLAKAPDQRYRTGDDLRSDLLRFRQGRSVSAATTAATMATTVVEGTQVLGTVGNRTQAIPIVPPQPPNSSGGGPGGDNPENLPSRTGAYITIALVLLAIFLVVGYFLGQSLGWWGKATSTTAVPNVVGQSVSQAQSTLSGDGFQVQTQTDATATSTASTQVVSTNPAAGSKLKRGATVTILTGAQTSTSTSVAPTIQVPNEKTQSVQAAETDLTGKGLHFTLQSSSSCTQQNIVCDQTPEPGAQVAGGTSVVLKTAPTTVSVPDVSSKSVTSACNVLNQAGLACGNTPQSVSSSSVPSGQVIGTSPAAGTLLATNSVVTIIESTGPASSTVPNVISESLSQADQNIQAAGLAPNSSCQVVVIPPSNGQATIVISQSPTVGTVVNPGSTVNLSIQAYMSCANPATPTTTTTTTSPSTTSSSTTS